MPHVGGGSSGGGFHSGGSFNSSSSSSYVPRKNVYGQNHSVYYRRPGYYYHGTYVPYSRVNRTYNAISGTFVILIFSFFFIVLSFFLMKYTADHASIEDYSLDRYSQIFEHDSYYEDHLMIEIIVYDNEEEIDYLPIVGDNVVGYVDSSFGNEYSSFGRSLYLALNRSSNKVSILYSSIEESLKEVNKSYSTKIRNNIPSCGKVLNNTSFDFGDSQDLEEAIKAFYDNTGYNVVVDINTYGSLHHMNYFVVFLFMGFGVLLIIAFISTIRKKLQAVKEINKADKEGNLEKYFEGEVKYEDHIKKHSMDEKYKYDPKEYEDLRKEFEIDLSKYKYDDSMFKMKDKDDSNKENK